jgi:hypothetical protein
MEELRKGLKICGLAGSQVRDVQGEILKIDGADISELQAGRGRLNDNHSQGFINTLGRVTFARKLYKEEDCENDRQKYFWNKLKSPVIYFEGELFDSEKHPSAEATAAILRHIHKSDVPLKIGASVEGGVVARSAVDSRVLEKTRVNAIALTFTPANRTTLVEPMNLSKSLVDEELDYSLIKSVSHLAQKDVPSFRYVYRDSKANKIQENVEKINKLLGNNAVSSVAAGRLLSNAISNKILENVKNINKLTKALVAGYGGGTPLSSTGGMVLQSESVDGADGFDVISCDKCGEKQVYSKYQVKCRSCDKPFSMSVLYRKFKKETSK